MTKKTKHKIHRPKEAFVEISEHISFDYENLPEYPKKLIVTYNDKIYYIYKLYHKICFERTSLQGVLVD